MNPRDTFSVDAAESESDRLDALVPPAGTILNRVHAAEVVLVLALGVIIATNPPALVVVAWLIGYAVLRVLRGYALNRYAVALMRSEYAHGQWDGRLACVRAVLAEPRARREDKEAA